MTYPTGLFGFAMLASMKPAERRRASTPLVMTMLPGPAAQRSALAAVAVTQQVKDSARRERRIAEDVVSAVDLAVQDPAGFTTDKLRGLPALRDLATDALRDKILALPPVVAALPAAAPAPVIDPQVVAQAAEVVALLVKNNGTKLTAAETAKFPDFMAALSPKQRADIS